MIINNAKSIDIINHSLESLVFVLMLEAVMYVTQGFINIYNLSYHSVQYGSSLPYKHLTNIIQGLYQKL